MKKAKKREIHIPVEIIERHSWCDHCSQLTLHEIYLLFGDFKLHKKCKVCSFQKVYKKEKKMSEEKIEVTKEKIRKLADNLCGDAKEAVEKAFPEAFEEENITNKIKWKNEPCPDTDFYWLEGFYEGECICFMTENTLKIHMGCEQKYEIKLYDAVNGAYQHFKILKKSK